ncbi:MAG TPA: hypothetical protein DCL63_02335 [Firmicutes bacterium]|jgi:ribosomal protein L32|nr:hypothetical protein [Bacillota bacterium]
MPLGNCTRCGKLFNRLSRPVCPDCAREEERHVDSVMAFLRENPSATIEEISQSTGVDIKIVLRLIRDDRLQATSAYTAVRNCKACGAPLTAGHYCGYCLRKFGQALSGSGGSRTGDPSTGGLGPVDRSSSSGLGGTRGRFSDTDRARTTRMATPERRRGGKKP